VKRGGRNLLQDLDVALVAHLIRRYQPVSRVDLAALAQLGRSTITEIVNLLIDHGVVVEVGEAESTGGRRPVLLELQPRSRLVACVRILPRTVLMGIADLNGRLTVQQRRALRGEREPASVLNRVITWVSEMLNESGVDKRCVIATGVVLPGRVNPDTGVLLESPFLGWRTVEVAAMLSGPLGLPVLVETDANAFALGEQLHGQPGGRESVLGVTIGATVGAGWTRRADAGRISAVSLNAMAHVQVDPDGLPCWCGRQGCLGVMVSNSGLVARALEALEQGEKSLITDLVEGRRGAINRDIIVAAAHEGDPLGMRLLAQAGEWIAEALAPLVNVLEPAALVFGGETVTQAGPLLLEPLRAALAPRLTPWAERHLRLEVSSLGEAAWLVGAAEVVLQRAFYSPLGACPGNRT